jgi:hypothetical protein
MRGTNTRAPRRAHKSSVRAAQPASTGAALVNAWWATVLAGNVFEPHPIHGGLKVRLDGGRLRLSGELESDEDRSQLVRQAREHIGRGIDRVDVSGLTVVSRKEKPGILEQTLISAFPNRDAAEFARAFVIKHSRVVPKQNDIVDPDHADKLRTLIPEDFVRDARQALDAGRWLLILQVDETEAFRVRELLEEDTRSKWTIGIPPRLIEAGS